MLSTLIGSRLKAIARRAYWFYRASRIQSGKNIRVGTRFAVEGAGRISMANAVFIEDGVTFAIAGKSNLTIGSHVRIGREVRVNSVANTNCTIGDRCSIAAGSWLFVHNNWKIGEGVNIGAHCQIFARESGCNGSLTVGQGTNIGDFNIIDVSADVMIGSTVALGPGCTIYTHDHDYRDKSASAPWKGRPVTKAVIVADGAWIGANVTILPGVTIGQNAIIAAGSVVTKSVPPYSLWAGVPAKMIKSLSNE